MSESKSTIRAVENDGTVIIDVTSEAELEEWRARLGQAVKVPTSPRNIGPEQCKVVVASPTYRRVTITLNRPWPVSFGGGPVREQSSWPVIWVEIRTATKAQNANVRAWAEMWAAGEADRKAFAEKVLNDAHEMGIPHADMKVYA